MKRQKHSTPHGITVHDLEPEDIKAILENNPDLMEIATTPRDSIFCAHQDDNSIIILKLGDDVSMVQLLGNTREKRTQVCRGIISKIAQKTEGGTESIFSPKQSLN
jgi:hypothetical protein